MTKLDILSVTERKTLALAADAWSNKEIGHQLICGTSNVQSHLNNIYAKFGLTHDHRINHRVAAVLVHLRATGQFVSGNLCMCPHTHNA